MIESLCMLVKDIAQLISDDLQRVDEAIVTHLTTDIRFISEVSHNVLSSGGKRICPVLLILCARMGNAVGKRVYDLSAVVEFLHTATLLHDDIIDNVHLRRGNPSIRSRWGTTMSILIGDYLYALSMELAIIDANHLIMETVAKVTQKMAKGQVIATLKKHDISLSEEAYYKIIVLKTAALFEASCTIGALVAGFSPQQRATVAAFGYHLGLAFQITDDVLDYLSPGEPLGKPVKNGLKEGKITLPIIAALKQAAPDEIEAISSFLQNPDATDIDFQKIVEIMNKYNSVQATLDKAQEHVILAKAHLREFPSSLALETLNLLANYVTTDVAHDHRATIKGVCSARLHPSMPHTIPHMTSHP